MHDLRTAARGLTLLALASLVLAACGSSSPSSGNASTLLSQTFSGVHKITSGNLNLSLTIDPSGSSTLSSPISLDFGGPFQTRGTGKLPASDFTVSATALGHNVALGVLSTGTNGYITLQGTSYQMPQATFQKLESSFNKLSPTAGQAGGGTLSSLGVHPLHWLTNPTIVGTETVGGAQTTHIHAGVNVPAMLSDLNTAVKRESGRSGLTASEQTKIASEIRNPSIDIWTGTSDKTLRRLTVLLTLTGKAAAAFGDATSADLTGTLQYADLNQPQTITAPTKLEPYSQFQSKVNAFVQTLAGTLGTSSLGGALGGGGTSTNSGSTGTSGSSASSNATKYGQCIQQAAGDVSKMQECASLLGSG